MKRQRKGNDSLDINAVHTYYDSVNEVRLWWFQTDLPGWCSSTPSECIDWCLLLASNACNCNVIVLWCILHLVIATPASMHLLLDGIIKCTQQLEELLCPAAAKLTHLWQKVLLPQTWTFLVVGCTSTNQQRFWQPVNHIIGWQFWCVGMAHLST